MVIGGTDSCQGKNKINFTFIGGTSHCECTTHIWGITLSFKVQALVNLKHINV